MVTHALTPHRFPQLLPLLASNVPFAIIFGVFVLAMVVLIVVVVIWAVRRDRAGRAAWRQRQENKAAGGDVPPAARP